MVLVMPRNCQGLSGVEPVSVGGFGQIDLGVGAGIVLAGLAVALAVSQVKPVK